MKELQKWIRENCLNSKGTLDSNFTANNGIKILKLNSDIYYKIITVTSHLEEIYQDFTFLKRLHFILDTQWHIKKWIKKESFYLNNLKIWIEEVLLDCNKTLKQAFLRENHIRIKNRFPTLYSKCFEVTDFLPNETPLIQRLWHIYNEKREIPVCEYCGKNQCSFKLFNLGYNRFCSCSCSSSGSIDKSKKTKIERYSDENYNNRDKAEETYFKKTGYCYPQQNPKIKKQTKKTKLEKYGDENYNNREKIENTNLERYGVKNIFLLPETQEKIRQNYFIETGYYSPLANPEVREKGKQYYIDNFGVTHNMHIGDVADRCKNGYKNSWHEYTLPSGEVIKLQGFEPKAFDLLLEEYDEDEILYRRTDMPKLFYVDKDNKQHRYYPDFYIPKDNLLVEVKSTYTYEASLEVNLLKEKISKEHGFNYRWMIL